MRILTTLLILIAAPALAEAPRLILPIECRLGESCWLMNYPDTDPGPAARDYSCRARSYDAHSGTDIAVRDLDAVAAGVAVLAAAAGTVVAARDGVADGLWLAGRKDEVVAARLQCGNRVAVDHGDGWVSDYCHMRRGSIRVKVGDKVAAGQALGLVGTSGMTDFPHAHLGLLHFAPGAKDGEPVDPFTGAENRAGCGCPAQPLWAEPLPYQGGNLYAAGFADHIPTGTEIKQHAEGVAALPPDAPALVVWGAMFGAARGDRLRVRLTAPDGAEILDSTVVVDGDQAWRLSGQGKKRPAAGWQAGRYGGVLTLERDGQSPQRRELSVQVGP